VGGAADATAAVTYNFAVSGITAGTALFTANFLGTLIDTQCGIGPGCPITAEVEYSGTATLNGVLLPSGAFDTANDGVPFNGKTTTVIFAEPVNNGSVSLTLGLSMFAACDGGPTSPACSSIADLFFPHENYRDERIGFEG
jgi:hypothetical protein